jgi:hypothetical protein
MKKAVFYLLAMALISSNILGQSPDFNSVRKYYSDLEKQINGHDHDTLLISYPALNVFMAKKVNTYLSGSSDLSLNRSYFILDPTDGRLFLGYNFSKDPSKGEKRTKFVLTVGLKANVAEAFSTIYNGDDKKMPGNIGASIKFTWLGRGIIFYDEGESQIEQNNLNQTFLYGIDPDAEIKYSQKQIARYYRKQLQNEIEEKMIKDSASYKTKMEGVGEVNYRKVQENIYFSKRNEYYKSLFITKEAENLEEIGYYKAYWNHWVSFDFYIPFTMQSFEVAKDLNSPISTENLYNFDGAILWNQIYERGKIRLLNSVVFGVKNLNNINTSLIKKYSINDYVTLGGVDTIKLAQIESKDVYIGPNEDYFTPYIRFQFISFFLAKKQIGLSFQIEKYLSNYDPLNLKIGIPVTLPGKDDETKVNFEVQFKWTDINNGIYPDKTMAEKFLIGLSVGVPLTSKIY